MLKEKKEWIEFYNFSEAEWETLISFKRSRNFKQHPSPDKLAESKGLFMRKMIFDKGNSYDIFQKAYNVFQKYVLMP